MSNQPPVARLPTTTSAIQATGADARRGFSSNFDPLADCTGLSRRNSRKSA